MMYICNSVDRTRCGSCGGANPHEHKGNPTLSYCEKVRKHVKCIPVDCLIPDYLFRIDGMERRTERMMKLLEQQLRACRKCTLHMNGRALPYWTVDYKGIAIVGEAPGREEIETNTPFCGKAGKILMGMLERHGIQREHCLIINSVNCRPVEGLKNGKPSALHLETCRPWINKYFGVLKPKKVLLLGNYALGTILEEDGITSKNATLLERDGVSYVKSVHPAYAIYAQEKGLQMLEKSVLLLSKV